MLNICYHLEQSPLKNLITQRQEKGQNPNSVLYFIQLNLAAVILASNIDKSHG